jgi:hypothetical protein
MDDSSEEWRATLMQDKLEAGDPACAMMPVRNR